METGGCFFPHHGKGGGVLKNGEKSSGPVCFFVLGFFFRRDGRGKKPKIRGPNGAKKGGPGVFPSGGGGFFGGGGGGRIDWGEEIVFPQSGSETLSGCFRGGCKITLFDGGLLF